MLMLIDKEKAPTGHKHLPITEVPQQQCILCCSTKTAQQLFHEN